MWVCGVQRCRCLLDTPYSAATASVSNRVSLAGACWCLNINNFPKIPQLICHLFTCFSMDSSPQSILSWKLHKSICRFLHLKHAVTVPKQVRWKLDFFSCGSPSVNGIIRKTFLCFWSWVRVEMIWGTLAPYSSTHLWGAGQLFSKWYRKQKEKSSLPLQRKEVNIGCFKRLKFCKDQEAPGYTQYRGLSCAPPKKKKRYVHVLMPLEKGPLQMKWGILWWARPGLPRWAIDLMVSVLRSNAREDRRRRRPCEGGGRDLSDAATGLGMPGAPRSWERQGRIPPEGFQGERGPANSFP